MEQKTETGELTAADRRKVWLYAAAGVLLIGGCSYAVYGDAESTGGPGGAELACKEKVRAQEGTATRFSDVTSYQMTDDRWQVNGTANGQSFICTLTYVSGERYTGTAELF